jgi:hypothetical protein
MRHLDEFENYFQDQFEDFESEPEPESWQKIHDRLHGKRRRIFFWWWIPMVAIATIGAGFFLFKGKNTSDLEAKNLPQKNVPSTIDTSNQPANTLTQENNPSVNQVTPSTNSTVLISANIQQTTSIQKLSPKSLPDSKVQIDNKSFEKIDLNNDGAIYHEVPNIKNTPILSSNTVKMKENINIALLSGLDLKTLDENKKTPVIEPKRSNLIEPVKKENPKWAVFVSAAPTYNLTNVSPNKDDKTFVTDVKTASLRSSNRIGVQAELGVLRQTNSRLQFFGALNYQWTPFSLDYTLYKAEVNNIDAFVSNAGKTVNVNKVNYTTSPETVQQNWHLASINTGIHFSLNKKNQLSIGVGAGKWLGKNALQGTPMYGIASYSYQFKSGLMLSPYLKYDFKTYQLSNDLFQVQPYQIGLKVNFKK